MNRKEEIIQVGKEIENIKNKTNENEDKITVLNNDLDGTKEKLNKEMDDINSSFEKIKEDVGNTNSYLDKMKKDVKLIIDDNKDKLIYFVDNVNGNDSNNGTSDNPVKTIECIWDRIPFVINRDIIIYLTTNYNGNVILTKKIMTSSKKRIVIQALQDKINWVGSLELVGIECAMTNLLYGIRIDSINFTNGVPKVNSGILINNVTHFVFKNCSFNDYNICFETYFSKGRMENCSFSNKGFACMMCYYSDIICENNTGNNDLGCALSSYYFSKIYIEGTFMTSKGTRFSKSVGGEILQ